MRCQWMRPTSPPRAHPLRLIPHHPYRWVRTDTPVAPDPASTFFLPEPPGRAQLLTEPGHQFCPDTHAGLRAMRPATTSRTSRDESQRQILCRSCSTPEVELAYDWCSTMDALGPCQQPIQCVITGIITHYCGPSEEIVARFCR